MIDLQIIPYTIEDNEAALNLEQRCTQGKKLVLKFQRPTFHARSGVYENYRILCAKVDNKLVGIVAGAEKFIKLYGETIRAVYIYDLRVHSDYRKYGTARRLTNAVLEDIGRDADCIYTMIAGENERALGLAHRSFGAQIVLPLTYTLMPVYKKCKVKNYHLTNASEVHKMYLDLNNSIEFLPEFDNKYLLGHFASITLGMKESCGCSIWTNEELLAEEVVKVPWSFQIMRALAISLRPFLKLPSIPKPMETIRSWFLFDFYARDKQSTRGLLSVVNNIALDRGRTFLYILLQSNDTMIRFIKGVGFRVFTLPYYFLAKGRVFPVPTDKIYIDVRDL